MMESFYCIIKLGNLRPFLKIRKKNARLWYYLTFMQLWQSLYNWKVESMEAHFCHRIKKTLKGNCGFFSELPHNSDFISHNSKFISHNSHNFYLEFTPRNCCFFSPWNKKWKKVITTLYLLIPIFSSQLWVFICYDFSYQNWTAHLYLAILSVISILGRKVKIRNSKKKYIYRIARKKSWS